MQRPRSRRRPYRVQHLGWPDNGVQSPGVAGRGPWCRVWRVAVWASHSLAALGSFLRPCPRRLAPRHCPDIDPNSATDTDTEDKPCQAHLVALAVSGSVVALSEGQCSDAAGGETIALLLEDAYRSATSELGGSRPRYTFEGCPTHRNAYVASRATRACSRVGCPRAKTHFRKGIPLCDEHLRPSGTWHDEPPAAPRALPGRDPLHRVGSRPPQSCQRTLAMHPLRLGSGGVNPVTPPPKLTSRSASS